MHERTSSVAGFELFGESNVGNCEIYESFGGSAAAITAPRGPKQVARALKTGGFQSRWPSRNQASWSRARPKTAQDSGIRRMLPLIGAEFAPGPTRHCGIATHIVRGHLPS